MTFWPGIAGDGVDQRIAGGVGAGAAGQRQLLDIGGERVGDRALHEIDARIARFHHHVAGIVDDIGVVAAAALHVVAEQAAVQDI